MTIFDETNVRAQFYDIDAEAEVDRTFLAIEAEPEKAIWVPEFSVAEFVLPEKLTMYRTYPKVSGSSAGTRRTGWNYSRFKETTNLKGETIRVPMTGKINFSIPVGIESADVNNFVATLIAIAMNLDTTEMTDGIAHNICQMADECRL
jgi:hypothetical protein